MPKHKLTPFIKKRTPKKKSRNMGDKDKKDKKDNPTPSTSKDFTQSTPLICGVKSLELPKDFEEIKHKDYARILKFKDTDEELIDPSDIKSCVVQGVEDKDSKSCASDDTDKEDESSQLSISEQVPHLEDISPRDTSDRQSSGNGDAVTNCPCRYCDLVNNIELFASSCNNLLSALTQEVALSDHFEWKAFWIDYQDYFLELLAEGHMQRIEDLFRYLTYPMPIARDIVDISRSSYRSGPSDDSKILRTEISTLIGNLRSSVKIAENETIAHHKNLTEFTNQVTRASSELGSNVSIIEKIVTQTSVRNVTATLPSEVITPYGFHLARKSQMPSPTDDETTLTTASLTDVRDIYDDTTQFIQLLGAEGTYSHKYMNIRIKDKKASSIAFSDPRFTGFDIYS